MRRAVQVAAALTVWVGAAGLAVGCCVVLMAVAWSGDVEDGDR